MGNGACTICPDLLEDGHDFEDAYEVDETRYIGTGKFSVVHLCWRRENPSEKYAMKVISTRTGDLGALARIREEIFILQELDRHPGIIQLVDVDDSSQHCIRLVVELCEGGELYDRIQQLRHYSEAEAKACVRTLLDAVAYMHGKGIMHRDLKPENILLATKASNTDVKISDFGLAKMSRDYPNQLPRSRSICGSDFYLAPEVIKQEEYGREIDIWAVGVITYVLLSGSLPFFHQVLHKLYRQIVERDLSFPEEAWRHVSKGALDFILRLLQVRASDRLTAEQALGHPWLRTPSNRVGSSFGTSFQDLANFGRSNSQSSNLSDRQRASNAALELQKVQSYVGARPNPLEHARKVSSNSSAAGVAGAAAANQPRARPPGAGGAASPMPPLMPFGNPMISPNYLGMQAQPGAVRRR